MCVHQGLPAQGIKRSALGSWGGPHSLSLTLLIEIKLQNEWQSQQQIIIHRTQAGPSRRILIEPQKWAQVQRPNSWEKLGWGESASHHHNGKHRCLHWESRMFWSTASIIAPERRKRLICEPSLLKQWPFGSLLTRLISGIEREPPHCILGRLV